MNLVNRINRLGMSLAASVWTRTSSLRDQRGQGTVEYVGLILLVSLVMVGVVASMKGFTGASGMELADVIVKKIRQGVDSIKFN